MRIDIPEQERFEIARDFYLDVYARCVASLAASDRGETWEPFSMCSFASELADEATDALFMRDDGGKFSDWIVDQLGDNRQ